jgi:1,2-diacylglycerol-3-alpha-glucose alpha-1,2-glucosyltransferase
MKNNMKISHPSTRIPLEGGIKTSIPNQRKALDEQGISYTPRYSRNSDVLHLNVLTPGGYIQLRQAKKSDIPVVIHTHEIGENFRESYRFSTLLSPAVRRYVDFFYQRADHLIAPTEYAKQTLEQRGLETSISVVSNGIEPERFAGVSTGEYNPNSVPNPGDTKQNSNNNDTDDRLSVINTSILFERKGLTDFTAVARELDDVDFVWYGPQFNRILTGSSVHKTVQNAPNHCVFPGFVDDVRDAYAAGDVFFYPTKSETEGMSVLEAAYCELPIVTRDIPVYDSLLEHGVHCLKGNSVDEFRRHIELLQGNPELREQLGKNARELAEQYTLDMIGERLETVYHRVLEQKRD